MTIRAVFVNAQERRYCEAGDVLFHAGDAGEQMFGVISGQVELRRGDTVVATVGEGDTFGEMAIVDAAPRSLTAVAVEPTELALIDQRVFMFLVHETPMFAIQVMRSLSARIRESQ